MFQVTLAMPNGTEDIAEIENAMPSGGWMVDLTGDMSTLVFYKDPSRIAGLVRVFPKKIAIRTDEVEPLGKEFWQDFARKYPELNPFDLRFGILYRPEGDGFEYELDEMPKHSPDEVLEDVTHYKKVGEAYFVKFRFGDWHNNEEITVLEYRKIQGDGTLGPIEKDREFFLGNLENAQTM
jgi:hypothetical protein